MKKLITVLVIIALLLVLGIAGALGYVWYRDNHIFVEDAVYPIDSQYLDLREQDISFEHYETVRSQLPNCEIDWDVPFQDTKYANDTESISISALTKEDIALLKEYLPKLKRVDASECSDYENLVYLQEQLPDVKVIYQVNLGGKSFAPETTELVLENGDYELAAMLENLKYLPEVTAITLRMPELSQEQVAQLKTAYEDITVTCTVGLLDQEYDAETTELDLSAIGSDDVAAVVEKLPLLPKLASVELMKEDGTSALTRADVKLLMEAAPNVVYHYTFDFFGHTLSTADEEVHIKNTSIGDEGVAQVREALDIMTNCKRFVLEYCGISNEAMAQLRNDYRNRTKIVWRVKFGKGSTLTDAEIIRAVYDLDDDNSGNLVYCEDVRYIDFGHNEWLDSCDFVSGMPNLEYIILSGAPIKSLEGFRNCKKLKMLEIAFCEYITDLSPLAECENLQMLNISNTKALDLSPLDNLPMTHLVSRVYPSGGSRVPQAEQDRFIQQHSDCWSSFTGAQPYGAGWRYDENNEEYLDHYALIREVFRYDLDPKIPNHTGWYLQDEETTYKEK